MQPRELRSLGVRALGTRPQTSSAPGLVLPSRRELCSREHATPIPPAASRCVFSRLARKRRPSPYKDEGLFVVPPYFAACAASLRRSDKRLIGNGITRKFLLPAAAPQDSRAGFKTSAPKLLPHLRLRTGLAAGEHLPPSRKMQSLNRSLCRSVEAYSSSSMPLSVNMRLLYRRPRALSRRTFRLIVSPALSLLSARLLSDYR